MNMKKLIYKSKSLNHTYGYAYIYYLEKICSVYAKEVIWKLFKDVIKNFYNQEV